MEDTNISLSSTETQTEQKLDKRAKKKKSKFRKFMKIFLLIFLFAAIIGGGGVAGYVVTLIKKAPALNLNALTNMAATTKVYDSNGDIMFDLQGDGDRDLIKSLDDVSPYVTQAFIAAEDKDFRSHIGINPLAIARAAVQSAVGGEIKSGASTITQQTIKLAMFPEQQQTLERKVQEAYLAIQLEKKLTKDEILVTYLNWMYFGKKGPENVYGIARAAKSYFGISAKDLNLAQATALAALPNNPSVYDLDENLDNTLTRQEYILQQMLANKFITEQQYQEAKQYDIAKAVADVKAKTEIKAGQFAHLNPELETRAAEILFKSGKYETLDSARQALFRGGYSIYSTIDRKLQQSIDDIINDNKFYYKNISYNITDNKGKQIHVDNAMEQAGATLIDNKTGKILAMGGGRNYEKDQVNHATRPRQPGSTMKPIAVYGPALDLKKIGSGTAIDDVPMVWPDQNAADGKYFPMNWDKRFHGLMTARTALKDSLNIPALKIFHEITPKVGLDYVRKMGVTTLTDDDNNLAAGIGGLSHGLTVEEATSAYTTIPNAGVWRDSYMIESIKDRDGNTIFTHTPQTVQVFNPNAAYILNNMMIDVVRNGTATQIGKHFPNKAIAGKTGTTNDNKDAWFVGYTPDYTLGVWIGYNMPYSMPDAQTTHTKDLWNAMMDKVFAQKGAATSQFFPNPGGVREIRVCKYSGKLATPLCEEDHSVTTELFIAGTEPREPDDVLVKAKYYEAGGKKYLANDSTPPYLVKEGIFIKREKYELPDGNKAYLPSDYEKEYPSDKDPKDDGISAQSDKAPTGLQVTASSANSVSLSWNPVQGSKGYLVLRSDSEAGPFQIAADVKTATSWTDSSVNANQPYSYEIVSLGEDDVHSVPSNMVTVKPGQSALVPPSGVSVQQAPVGLTVTWSPVPGATGYTVYRSNDPAGSFQKVSDTKSPSYSDIAALPGATFYYKVTTLMGDQESNASTPVSATVPANGQGDKLTAPTGVSVTNPKTGNSLIVSWGPVKGATSYSIERSTDGANWTEVGNTGNNSYTDAGLTANQTYFYRVRALGAGNTASSSSQAASGTPTQ